MRKNAHFYQLSDPKVLNSMYNKHLHKHFTPKYHSQEEFTHCSSGGKIYKTNPISAFTFTHLLIYPFTHPHIHAKQTQFQQADHERRITNQAIEAKRRSRQSGKQTQFYSQRPLAHITKRATGHGSRFIQNEPNFTHNASWPTSPNGSRVTIHPKRTQFYPQFFILFLQLFTRQMPTFPKKSQKMRIFCNSVTLTYLTPCTTKTYITFCPQIPLTRGIYTQFVWRKKSKTNPKQTHCRWRF